MNCACRYSDQGIVELCGAHMTIVQKRCAEEREACAKIADFHNEKAEDWYLDGDGDPALVKENTKDWKECAVLIASDIRARST